MAHYEENKLKWIQAIIMAGLLVGCIKDREYGQPALDCVSTEMVNATFSEVKALYVGETKVIQEDLVIEGVVISSDKAGNFFGSLHFQDETDSSHQGFQLDMDLRDAHLFYPVGSRIVLKVKGLYLGKSRGVFKLGGVFTAFGNQSIGRLPAAAVAGHLFSGCEPAGIPEPLTVTVNALDDAMLNTLVRLEELEFAEEELGKAYALPELEAVHTLQDCEGNELQLLISGYSDFRDQLLPEGNGSATGVLHKEGDSYRLIIRDTTDLDFSGDRCMEAGPTAGSKQIFFSELADPDNNADARFLELYYTGEQELPLNGWRLLRYTNENTEVSSSLDLSGQRIFPNSTLVIAANAVAFEAVYGFPPDMEGGSNGPADSNGDDNLELLDPSGNVIDIFGIVGEDGSGTSHEFEDGRALRRDFVNAGNPQFTFAEWEIHNDSGQAGTTNLPKNAPNDFSPGIH